MSAPQGRMAGASRNGGRFQVGLMSGRRGPGMVKTARSRLRSRKAGRWDIAGWLRNYTLLAYTWQAGIRSDAQRLCPTRVASAGQG